VSLFSKYTGTLVAQTIVAGIVASQAWAGIDFEASVLPLLQEKCFRCHSSRIPEPGAELRLDSMALIKKGSYYGDVLTPGAPEQSELFARVALPHDDDDLMPPAGKGDPLTPDQLAILRNWISEGANFRSWKEIEKPDTARPSRKQNKNKGVSRLAVQNYGKKSGNQGLDLTPSKKYSTRLTPNMVKGFAAEIDQWVDQYRAEHGVESLPQSDDKVFVRRAYLNIVGRTPTLEESLSFLASTDRKKRTKLIDRLINTDGYVNHWFHYWANLLRVQSERFTSTIFYAEWVKQALRDNMPYNQMVYELVTAVGLPHQNGAVGWMANDFNMAPDHMANTMQAFMGMQLQCAQCHDHPYDRWNQHEFQSLVSFMSGVRWSNQSGNYFRRQLERQGLTDSTSEIQQRYFRGGLGNVFRYGVFEPSFTRWNQLPKDYQYADAKPNQPVPPRVLFGEQPTIKDSPREAFGEWLTDQENEWFTKAIANRLWKQTMGVGLIEPVDNIKYDTQPSIPGLLNLLERYMKQVDYNLKDFLRILYNTQTWQMTTLTEDLPEDLGQYHYEGRPLMRMTGEQIWDSFVALAIEDPDERKGHGSRFTTDPERMRFEKIFTSSLEENLAHFTDEVIQKERKERQVEAKQAVKQFGSKPAARMKVKQGRGNRGFNSWSFDHMTDPRWRGMDRGLVRAAELTSPAPAFHMVRQFGQSDRKIIGAGRRDANVTQVLNMLNGPIHTVLDGECSVLALQMGKQESAEERVKVIFRSILTRNPTPEDMEIALNVLKANPGRIGYRMILWALLNTREFMFIQ